MSYPSTIYLKLFCILAFFSSIVYGKHPQVNRLVEHGVFIQIPGPNPILKPGPLGSWDDNILESSDAFEEYGTYYLYYHGSKGAAYGDSGVGEGKGVSNRGRVGASSAGTVYQVREKSNSGNWPGRRVGRQGPGLCDGTPGWP